MIRTRHVSELSCSEYAMLSDQYTRVRHCALCGEAYKELHNMGRLCCRLHTGVLCMGHRGDYIYSCCRQTSGSVGCVRTDHMDSMPDTGDEQQRHQELKSFAIKVIPTILFEYGISRPLNECILLHQQQRHTGAEAVALANKNSGVAVRYTLPATGQTVQHYIGDMMRALSASVAVEPLLTHIYGRDEQGASYKKLLSEINDRWPETCVKQEDGPTTLHRMGDAANDTISPESLYIIPFVVICRIR